MNTQKFLVSGIISGVVSFFAGYLIYGLLLADFFAKQAGPAGNVMRQPTDMIWWAMIAGSLGYGLMLSYIFNKWTDIKSLGAGFGPGLIIGFFMTAGFDLMMYGSTTLSTITGTCADIVCGSIMGGITGAVVGLANGFGKKAA
jgi:hypothetical protein